MLKFTWKKAKHQRYSSFYHNGYDLNYGGEVKARVRPLHGGLWYWYGFGQNTAKTPHDSELQCKDDCLAFAKTKLAELQVQFEKDADGI